MAPKRKPELETFEKLTKPFLSDKLITIKLDDSSQTHKVSKALLCQASPYFEKALNGNFAEATSSTLHLPGCDTDTFKLFIGYLATHRLPDYRSMIASLGTDIRPQAHNVSIGAQVDLVKIWSFAEAHILPKLQNKAMRELLGVFGRRCVHMQTSELAYEITPSESAMRKMIVDEDVFDFASDDYDDRYNTEWFSQMGLVNHYLHDFTRRLAACKGGTCDHGDDCQPSNMKDQSRYMVPED